MLDLVLLIRIVYILINSDNSNRHNVAEPKSRTNNEREAKFNNIGELPKKTTTRKPVNSFWSQWSALNSVNVSNKLMEQTNTNNSDGSISISLDESLIFSSTNMRYIDNNR